MDLPAGFTIYEHGEQVKNVLWLLQGDVQAPAPLYGECNPELCIFSDGDRPGAEFYGYGRYVPILAWDLECQVRVKPTDWDAYNPGGDETFARRVDEEVVVAHARQTLLGHRRHSAEKRRSVMPAFFSAGEKEKKKKRHTCILRDFR